MNFSQSCSIPSASTSSRVRRALIASPFVFIGAFLLSLFIGSSDASPIGALKDLFSANFSGAHYRIIFHVRLPRTLGALFAGAALALSGVIIQAVLDNPLAAPNVIGVGSGAAFTAICCMAIFPTLIYLMPLAAFLGALLAALLIYAISAISGAGRVTVTLVGVAVGSILTALTNTVKVLFPDSVYDVTGFLIGSLSAAGSLRVYPAIALIIPVAALCILLSPRLDVLSLGGAVASSLGVRVRRERLLFLTAAAVLAGAAVSYAGLVGFVGLIVPNLIRRLYGGSHRYLCPLSLLYGGAFLAIADTLARAIFSPYELPVGIILSLIGAPFFIWLLLYRRVRL